MELFEKPVVSADDHWAFNLDIKNLLAQRMRPAIIDAFEHDADLSPLADELAAWDLLDDKNEAAPLHPRQSGCPLDWRR